MSILDSMWGYLCKKFLEKNEKTLGKEDQAIVLASIELGIDGISQQQKQWPSQLEPLSFIPQCFKLVMLYVCAYKISLSLMCMYVCTERTFLG